MNDQSSHDDFEHSAGGLDYDDPVRERAEDLGSRLAQGPEALLEEVERLIPDPVKEQVRNFPITALLLGVGIGIYLGMKKGDELISAGSAAVSAAITANLGSALGSFEQA